jgi:hypothetical protein
MLPGKMGHNKFISAPHFFGFITFCCWPNRLPISEKAKARIINDVFILKI